MTDDTNVTAATQAAALQLDFLADPGHGWLEVDAVHLRTLGIQAQVSIHSYLSHDRSKAYLEEDCDAPLYLRACRGASLHVQAREHHSDASSFIRQLPRYEARPRGQV